MSNITPGHSILVPGLYGERIIAATNQLFLALVERVIPQYFQEKGLVDQDVKPGGSYQLTLSFKGSRELGDKSYVSVRVSLGSWDHPFLFEISSAGFKGAISVRDDLSLEDFFPTLIQQLELLKKYGSKYKSKLVKGFD